MMSDEKRADDVLQIHNRTIEAVALSLARSEQLMRSSQELMRRSDELLRYEPRGPIGRK